MPWRYIRLMVCERMGWLFSEFDDEDALDVVQALQMWQVKSDVDKHKRAVSRGR